MSDVRPTQCPYCGKAAVFDTRTSTIICEHCDAEYKIVERKGVKVKKTGVLADFENRLTALEQVSPIVTAANPRGNGELEGDIPSSDGDGEKEEEIFPE